MKKPSKRTLIYNALCEGIDAQTANIEAYGEDSPESASAAFLRDCYREILVKDYGVSKTPMEELADQNKGKGVNLFSYVSGKGGSDGN